MAQKHSLSNRIQTNDNLNTSWILGTQTLKGYTMFHQHGSSSEKQTANDLPDRNRDLRDQIPLRSQEKYPPSSEESPAQMRRERTEHDRAPNRKLRGRPERELTERNDRDYDLKNRSEREKNLREMKERNDGEIKFRTEAREKADVRPAEEKDVGARKSVSLGRLREGPVKRLCEICFVKDVKNKPEENEADEGISQESCKAGNNSENEAGYTGMNTGVKRKRRTSQVEDIDMSDSSDTPDPRKCSPRQKKPTLGKFQANAEPVGRSIGSLRNVLSNSIRKCEYKSKNSSSNDPNYSQPQRYDKKESNKSRVKPDLIIKCDHCGYESNRRFNVLRHEKRVHGRSKRNIICCNKQFKTKGEVYAHIEVHHPKRKRGVTVFRLKYKIVKPLLHTYRLENRNGRIFTQDVEVNLDPDIMWPPKETIMEYLNDIEFDV